ncbi:GTP pyrophosphokinase family protein [Pseudomonas sp. GV071]|uniref:GTP pyrophosphokinase n=1 Tax=Pseudomonas sp. GV071 TaxID=2135754 RepID=UPI000D3C4EBD|nr:hypothetical protein [Pseudomonas sp. GV071]PTQ67878.1 ppGpp synthetase/RelA/SpoT-type nucleotidyltransferase [Pseudomonas sp. GV071]
MSSFELVEEYEDNLELYTGFSRSMDALFRVLLDSFSIKPHSISCRVKDKSSFQRKINEKNKYSSMAEVTDVVGLRVISHYADDVDAVARIIENEFQVDVKNSIDKRVSLDPDRFGYLSLHYVVSLKKERFALAEYKRFKGLKFEIQVRSILQHTWAEIEHDIGYKAKIEIPKPIRRKFSRLAGLLELADDQFVQIRDDLAKYEVEVKEKLYSQPETLSIDAVSLLEYISRSEVVKGLDRELSNITELVLVPADKSNMAVHLKALKYFNIESVSMLEQELIVNKENIIIRAIDVGRQTASTAEGLCVYYLGQVLAAIRLKYQNEIAEYLRLVSITDDAGEFSKYLSELSKRISSPR